MSESPSQETQDRPAGSRSHTGLTSSKQASWLRRWDQTGVPFLVARVLLGVVFILMGAAKTSDPAGFLKMIREYHMFPEQTYLLMNLTAVVLPWLEVVCGMLLLLGLATRGSALLLAMLLAAFTVAVAARAIGIYHAGNIPFCAIKFDCGCGAGEQYICTKIPENTGLFLLSLIVLLSRSRRLGLADLIRPASTN